MNGSRRSTLLLISCGSFRFGKFLCSKGACRVVTIERCGECSVAVSVCGVLAGFCELRVTTAGAKVRVTVLFGAGSIGAVVTTGAFGVVVEVVCVVRIDRV